MVATAIAKPVERINGLTSISDRDQVGQKTITVRGDCLKCSDELLPLIDAEGARDLAKRSPFVIKKSVKKGKKGTKKTFKAFKKGGKKTFKKTKVPPFNKPFKKGVKKTGKKAKKGGKKTFKKGSKAAIKSSPFSIPAAGIALGGGGGGFAFGAPGFGAIPVIGGAVGDGFLGGTGADVAFDTIVFGADQ